MNAKCVKPKTLWTMCCVGEILRMHCYITLSTLHSIILHPTVVYCFIHAAQISRQRNL